MVVHTVLLARQVTILRKKWDIQCRKHRIPIQTITISNSSIVAIDSLPRLNHL
ncbi:MAG: hypothetical protein ACFFB5_09065 [Promethearchaeota archaeon]